MFRLVKGLKTDSKEVDSGRCMRGCDGKLCFSEKERGKVWKNYMERIMNEENDWDLNVEGDTVEGAVVCVSREKVLQALNENMKSSWTFRSQRSLRLQLACTKDQSPFLFVVVVDVVTEFVRVGALSELLYADDLVLMSETIDGLRNKFLKWKETFESRAWCRK